MCFLPIIKRWLAWEIGSRNRVVLGCDPFISCNFNFKLSIPLIQFLNNTSIYIIAQAVVPDVFGTNHKWLESNQLGLSDGLETEWEKKIQV